MGKFSRDNYVRLRRHIRAGDVIDGYAIQKGMIGRCFRISNPQHYTNRQGIDKVDYHCQCVNTTGTGDSSPKWCWLPEEALERVPWWRILWLRYLEWGR